MCVRVLNNEIVIMLFMRLRCTACWGFSAQQAALPFR